MYRARLIRNDAGPASHVFLLYDRIRDRIRKTTNAHRTHTNYVWGQWVPKQGSLIGVFELEVGIGTGLSVEFHRFLTFMVTGIRQAALKKIPEQFGIFVN